MLRKRPKFLRTGIKAGLLRSVGLPENERIPAAMTMSLLVACVVALTVSTTLGAFVYIYQGPQDLLAFRMESRDVRTVQLALLDVRTGARGFALSSRPEYLQPYSVGSQMLDDNRATLDKFDRFVAGPSGGAPGTQTVSSFVAYFRSDLAKLIDAARSGSAGGAGLLARLDSTKATMDGSMRDELLNETLFVTLAHARTVIALWVADCNERRPHSALGYQTPSAYAASFFPAPGAAAPFSTQDSAKAG
jgi:CHASE3 domain sensor protein